ncbi:MAG: hypothetical protein K0V04_07225 [Deltaproteobacteria bacterium]|nr:hypothetical protein [Deltaproteobacteria bacterium]
MNTAEAWVDDARAALDRHIVAAKAQPDFLDVVTRAHALDPEAVSSQMVDDADALALARDTDEEPAGNDPVQADLDQWLGDVRAAVDRRVEARRQGPAPALVVPARDRRAWWWVGGAVAAALLLAVGVGPLMRAVDRGGDTTPGQALHSSEPMSTTGAYEPIEQTSPRMETQPTEVRKAVIRPEAVPELEVEPEPEPEPKRAVSRRDRLAALADRAQAHWQAGRRDEAGRLFSKIVAEGGRSRAAEMAFADLFTLAHQARDTAAQRSWWKRYLRRFARGRFADDARAGLCRTVASAKRAACWSEYLRDFPRGSFRAEARAVTGDPTP